MKNLLKTTARLAHVAAVCALLAACGGNGAEAIDPNAAVREEAERRVDAAIPTLQITAPTTSNAFSSMGTTVNFAGVAGDDRKVSRVTWVNDRGGNGIATQSGTSTSVTWSAAASFLPRATTQ